MVRQVRQPTLTQSSPPPPPPTQSRPTSSLGNSSTAASRLPVAGSRIARPRTILKERTDQNKRPAVDLPSKRRGAASKAAAAAAPPARTSLERSDSPMATSWGAGSKPTPRGVRVPAGASPALLRGAEDTMIWDIAPPADMPSSSAFGDEYGDDNEPGPSRRTPRGRGVTGAGRLLTPADSQEITASARRRQRQSGASTVTRPVSRSHLATAHDSPPSSSRVRPRDSLSPPLRLRTSRRRKDPDSSDHDELPESPSPKKKRPRTSQAARSVSAPQPATAAPNTVKAARTAPTSKTPAADSAASSRHAPPATAPAKRQRQPSAEQARRLSTPITFRPSETPITPSMRRETVSFKRGLSPTAREILRGVFVGTSDTALQPEPGDDPILLMAKRRQSVPTTKRKSKSARKSSAKKVTRANDGDLAEYGDDTIAHIPSDAYDGPEDTFAAMDRRPPRHPPSMLGAQRLSSSLHAVTADMAHDDLEQPANQNSPFLRRGERAGFSPSEAPGLSLSRLVALDRAASPSTSEATARGPPLHLSDGIESQGQFANAPSASPSLSPEPYFAAPSDDSDQGFVAEVEAEAEEAAHPSPQKAATVQDLLAERRAAAARRTVSASPFSPGSAPTLVFSDERSLGMPSSPPMAGAEEGGMTSTPRARRGVGVPDERHRGSSVASEASAASGGTARARSRSRTPRDVVSSPPREKIAELHTPRSGSTRDAEILADEDEDGSELEGDDALENEVAVDEGENAASSRSPSPVMARSSPAMGSASPGLAGSSPALASPPPADIPSSPAIGVAVEDEDEGDDIEHYRGEIGEEEVAMEEEDEEEDEELLFDEEEPTFAEEDTLLAEEEPSLDEEDDFASTELHDPVAMENNAPSSDTEDKEDAQDPEPNEEIAAVLSSEGNIPTEAEARLDNLQPADDHIDPEVIAEGARVPSVEASSPTAEPVDELSSPTTHPDEEQPHRSEDRSSVALEDAGQAFFQTNMSTLAAEFLNDLSSDDEDAADEEHTAMMLMEYSQEISIEDDVAVAVEDDNKAPGEDEADDIAVTAEASVVVEQTVVAMSSWRSTVFARPADQVESAIVPEATSDLPAEAPSTQVTASKFSPRPTVEDAEEDDIAPTASTEAEEGRSTTPPLRSADESASPLQEKQPLLPAAEHARELSVVREEDELIVSVEDQGDSIDLDVSAATIDVGDEDMDISAAALNVENDDLDTSAATVVIGDDSELDIPPVPSLTYRENSAAIAAEEEEINASADTIIIGDGDDSRDISMSGITSQEIDLSAELSRGSDDVQDGPGHAITDEQDLHASAASIVVGDGLELDALPEPARIAQEVSPTVLAEEEEVNASADTIVIAEGDDSRDIDLSGDVSREIDSNVDVSRETNDSLDCVRNVDVSADTIITEASGDDLDVSAVTLEVDNSASELRANNGDTSGDDSLPDENREAKDHDSENSHSDDDNHVSTETEARVLYTPPRYGIDEVVKAALGAGMVIDPASDDAPHEDTELSTSEAAVAAAESSTAVAEVAPRPSSPPPSHAERSSPPPEEAPEPEIPLRVRRKMDAGSTPVRPRLSSTSQRQSSPTSPTPAALDLSPRRSPRLNRLPLPVESPGAASSSELAPPSRRSMRLSRGASPLSQVVDSVQLASPRKGQAELAPERAVTPQEEKTFRRTTPAPVASVQREASAVREATPVHEVTPARAATQEREVTPLASTTSVRASTPSGSTPVKVATTPAQVAARSRPSTPLQSATPLLAVTPASAASAVAAEPGENGVQAHARSPAPVERQSSEAPMSSSSPSCSVSAAEWTHDPSPKKSALSSPTRNLRLTASPMHRRAASPLKSPVPFAVFSAQTSPRVLPEVLVEAHRIVPSPSTKSFQAAALAEDKTSVALPSVTVIGASSDSESDIGADDTLDGDSDAWNITAAELTFDAQDVTANAHFAAHQFAGDAWDVTRIEREESLGSTRAPPSASARSATPLSSARMGRRQSRTASAQPSPRAPPTPSLSVRESVPPLATRSPSRTSARASSALRQSRTPMRFDQAPEQHDDASLDSLQPEDTTQRPRQSQGVPPQSDNRVVGFGPREEDEDEGLARSEDDSADDGELEDEVEDDGKIMLRAVTRVVKIEPEDDEEVPQTRAEAVDEDDRNAEAVADEPAPSTAAAETRPAEASHVTAAEVRRLSSPITLSRSPSRRSRSSVIPPPPPEEPAQRSPALARPDEAQSRPVPEVLRYAPPSFQSASFQPQLPISQSRPQAASARREPAPDTLGPGLSSTSHRRMSSHSTRPAVPSALSREVPLESPQRSLHDELTFADDEDSMENSFRSVVEVSSLDPRAAARAAAILKMNHRYIEHGIMDGTPRASVSRLPDTPFPAAERTEVYESMEAEMRKQRLLHDAELDLVLNDRSLRSVSVFTAASVMDSPLHIPGAWRKTPKRKRQARTPSPPQPVVATGGRPWRGKEWKRLHRAYRSERAKWVREREVRGLPGSTSAAWTPFRRSQVPEPVPWDNNRVVDAFIQARGVKEEELSGEWSRTVIANRVAGIAARFGDHDEEERSEPSAKRARIERRSEGSAPAPPSTVKRMLNWVLGLNPTEKSTPTQRTVSGEMERAERGESRSPHGFIQRNDETVDFDVTMATPSRAVESQPTRRHGRPMRQLPNIARVTEDTPCRSRSRSRCSASGRSPSAPPLRSPSPDPTQLEDDEYRYNETSTSLYPPLHPGLPDRSAALATDRSFQSHSAPNRSSARHSVPDRSFASHSAPDRSFASRSFADRTFDRTFDPNNTISGTPRPKVRVRSASGPTAMPLPLTAKSRDPPNVRNLVKGFEETSRLDLSFESERREREKLRLKNLHRVRSTVEHLRRRES